MTIRSLFLALNLTGLLSTTMLAAVSPAAIGSHGFDLDVDIGSVRHPGGSAYSASQRVYSLRGSGFNMWFGADAFHFLGKKVSGDFTVAAAVEWPQAGQEPHRKAGLMLRQSLDASSPYVDAVVHGDGLTSLQFREVSGGPTREIQAAVSRPMRLRLERWGDVFSMSVMVTNGIWQSSGCVVRLPLPDPVYAGLLVCAHDEQTVEEARFGHVQCVEQPLANLSPTNRVSYPPDITRCLAVRDRWEKEILAYETSDQTNLPPEHAILFLGSSTMRLWRTLTQDFPGLPVLGRGFGGSQIADSLYFADRLVLPYRPRQIVLYAGDNDLAAHQSPDRVVADFAALSKVIHRSLPKTRLTFLAIKPSFARWALLDKMQRANQLVAEFCQTHPGCEFVDTFTPTLGPDGHPRREWFESDGLHLNRAGYAAWATVIRPFLLTEEKAGKNGRN